MQKAPFRPFPIKDSGKPPFNDSSVAQKKGRVEPAASGCPKFGLSAELAEIERLEQRHARLFYMRDQCG